MCLACEASWRLLVVNSIVCIYSVPLSLTAAIVFGVSPTFGIDKGKHESLSDVPQPRFDVQSERSWHES